MSIISLSPLRPLARPAHARPGAPPRVIALVPAEMEAGSQMRVVVHGAGFTPASRIHFDGAEQATEFIGDEQLAFEAAPEAPGTYPVTVVNPPGQGGGGGQSNPVNLYVAAAEPPEPEPTIGSLEPGSVSLPPPAGPAARRR